AGAQPGAARLGAATRGAHFAVRAGRRAVAAMTWIVGDIHAAVTARHQARVASAACGARTDLRRGAARVTTAAVRDVAAGIDAARVAQAETGRAICRAHPEITNFVRAAAHGAVAAMRRVGGEVAACPVALQLGPR